MWLSQLALDGGEIISIFEGGGGKGEESCGDDWRVRSEQEYAGEKLDGWIECNLDIELTWRGLMRCGGELDVGYFATMDLLPLRPLIPRCLICVTISVE